MKSITKKNSLLTFQSKFKLDGPGSSVGNLTLGYTPYWINLHQYDTREFVSGDHGARDTTQTLSGAYYDINADYEFTLGPGRLKLIGLDHHDHEPFITTQVTHFDSRPFDNGVRFGRNSLIDERIGRGEYHWKSGKNDWQLSFERAFDSLNQRGSLSILNEDGVFEPQDFPEGSGHVTEVRYEGIATLSRPLSSKLDLQVAAGAEQSTLDRVDDELPARKFFRPKGSLTLGWRPPRDGTRASRSAAGSARSVFTTSSPSRSWSRTAKMPAIRISSRRKAGNSKPKSGASSANGAKPAFAAGITRSTTSST